jgi:effector-binding domain-containing protein
MKPSSTARTPAALLLLGATAFSQGTPDAATAELLARVDAVRGRSTKPLDTLVVEGTFEVRFDETGPQPIVTGTFRDVWAGRATHRHTGTMTDVADLARGVADGVVWEIEPNMGAKVHDGAKAAALQRWFALQRGAPASELYRAVANDGTRELDGAPHVVLKMTPPEGVPDTWWIEPKSARIARIDLELPTPQDCVVVFGFPDWSKSRLTFADWKRFDGVDFPCLRVVRMGSMEIMLAATKVERGVTLDPRSLALPEAVVKAASRAAAGASSPYEIVDRAVQPTAVIRVQCKQAELSATLATIFPEVIGSVQESGAKMAGMPFTLYHSMDGDLLDLEAGIPVVKAFEGKGRVKGSQLPAGRTLMTWHSGPYDQLPSAHETLRQHAAQQKLVPRAGIWEYYWTDPGMVPDPAKWKTQLFLPVE